MENYIQKDIFISYRNDGCGNQFASRLTRDLTELGYSVYFNDLEERSENFPKRLENAIAGCKDFILILSPECMKRLMTDNLIDWVRKEILTAKKYEKHIIPILINKAEMPSNPEDMPAELKFLPYIDAIHFPDQYMKSPFSELLYDLIAQRDGSDQLKDCFSNNPKFNITNEFQTLQIEADNGNVNAMYEIAIIYYYGITSEKNESERNFEKAAYWFQKVAESDQALKYNADNMLARMYYKGIMPREEQSYEKAYFLHKCAAKYDVYAAAQQAFMQRIGCGCEFDYNSIIDFYNSEAAFNDDQAKLELAKFYTKYGKFEQAFELYNSMSYLTAEAEYRIGMLYKDGVLCDPPKPDYIQAAYYLRNAADSNYIEAAYEFAMLNFNPTGRMKKNFVTAEKYFTIAADGGNSQAQYVLGYMFKYGVVRRDFEKAIYYLEKARKQGNPLAMLELILLYQEKEYCNYQSSFECAKDAASYGIGEAEYLLGVMYLLGRGCEFDENRAYELFTRAMNHGIHCAELMRKKLE